jgi:muramoyltetrapeptide carboxypeptidase
MITSPALETGDKVAIVATARKVAADEISPAVAIIRRWGFEAGLGMNLFSEHHQFAGTDNQRWAELQIALDDPNIKAILFARGGYGTVRIIDKLDFTAFIKSPKWLIGFSDVTALFAHVLHNCKVQTIHGPMALTLPQCDENVRNNLLQILTGKPVKYRVKTHLLNRRGKATGELVGGNLSVLYSLSGTNSAPLTRGKILFLEDLDEYLYHIDRMMMNLKRSGKLDGIKGLIVGGMTQMNDNDIPFGLSAEEIILDAVSEFNFPVCFGFPAGHINNNHPLVLGKKITLTVSENVEIRF